MKFSQLCSLFMLYSKFEGEKTIKETSSSTSQHERYFITLGDILTSHRDENFMCFSMIMNEVEFYSYIIIVWNVISFFFAIFKIRFLLNSFYFNSKLSVQSFLDYIEHKIIRHANFVRLDNAFMTYPYYKA